MCMKPAVFRWPCFLGVLHALFFTLPAPSSLGIPEPRGQRFGEDNLTKAECSKISHSAYFPAVGHCVCSHLLQKEASLMMTEQATNL